MNAHGRQAADADRRQDAIDASRSFIVQAPAGSGKTELLIQRMLRLLARVEQPEEVLAITFTRKAAAEMRNRLVTELREAARDPGAGGLEPHKQLSRELAVQVLQADQAGHWELLLQPNRLQVRTIDSLCSELARRLPILSGLGGGLRVAEQPEALYQRAALRTLAVIESAHDPLQPHLVRVLD
ncbi:MAG: UvrD-helicase domain-containing protein, partial [Xanthomonadales bacterium]|nr:UvrD-helicase domain-containing protein [Xanthomonadales bacterium]